MKKGILLTISLAIIIGLGFLINQLFVPSTDLNMLERGTLVEQGNAAVTVGDYVTALNKYNQSIQSGIDLAAAYAQRGNLFLRQRQFTEAIADFTQAYSLNPSAELLAARCNAYRLMVRLDDAMVDCEAAFAQSPESVEVAAVTGLLYVDRKDPARADEVIASALSAHPDSDRLFYVKAQIANIEGDTPRVIEMLTRCLDINPSSIQYLWDRGFAYYMNAQLDESKADLKKIIKLGDPMVDGETMYYAGNLLRMMGENP